jgi:hypothetical protein
MLEENPWDTKILMFLYLKSDMNDKPLNFCSQSDAELTSTIISHVEYSFPFSDPLSEKVMQKVYKIE